MHWTTHGTLALWLAGLLGLAPLLAFPPLADDEAKLSAKLARETDPVKKAKIEIQLSVLKLRAAKETRDKNQVDDSLKLLKDYHQHITNAWELLRKSGRVAHKKPQGFKELEIAIRGDERFLADLKRNYSFKDREGIETIIADVKRIRAEVLKALFPSLEGVVP